MKDYKTISLDNNEKQLYTEILKKATKFFQKMLLSKSASEARILLEKWELTSDTIKTFGLGYALDSMNALTSHLLQEGYTEESLVKSGIAVFDEDEQCADRFRNRIMIPIMDVNESVVGFCGRFIGNDNPKWLNSPETVIFNKKQNLFSLQHAKHQRELILVEGVLDVVFLYQNGIKNAVTSFGMPLVPEQARLMKEYADKVTICYDADRTINLDIMHAFYGQNIDVRILELEQKDGCRDPYEYVKNNGTRKFAELLNSAETVKEFKKRNEMGLYK